jgi:hypothetical protein
MPQPKRVCAIKQIWAARQKSGQPFAFSFGMLRFGTGKALVVFVLVFVLVFVVPIVPILVILGGWKIGPIEFHGIQANNFQFRLTVRADQLLAHFE